MATLTKSGYGQVEPNHLSAQRTGQIYAQLPCASDIEALENGTFVKYDYASGEVNFSGPGEWMLVFNEVKLYDVRQYTADYRMTSGEAVNGEMVPRVFKTNPGDIFTTNQVVNGSGYVAGALLVPNASGILEIAATPTLGDMVWQVVDVTTLPDSKAAVKVMRLVDQVPVVNASGVVTNG